MKYAYIRGQSQSYPVRLTCRLLGVSASGYYAWLGRSQSARTQDDHLLLDKIKHVHKASKGTYGSPRIHAQLRSEGFTVGRHKIARLMRSNHLRGCPKKRYRATTQSNPSHRVADNLLEQDFVASGPDQKWASDITYISTHQGWLYLAVTMDLFSRRIIGPSQRMWNIRLPVNGSMGH